MFRFFKNNKKSARARHHRTRTLGFEQVEGRQLMAASVFSNVLNDLPVFEMTPDLTAEGSITLNPSTGVVTIEGSNNYGDSAVVSMSRGPRFLSQLSVSLSNVNVPLVTSFDPATVTKIVFHGNGGNDKFDNRTSVPVYAEGGAGNDMLFGGSADDLLAGGDGDDYLDGRAGADYLFGQLGNDALFGDDGYDSLYGGDGVDFLFGGNNDDSLYGEAGNDKLYGEGGGDRLIDTLGTNTKYTDYGPTYNVSVSGFQSFDWFDRYLKDPAVRSLARQEYFQGGVLDRADMLNVYNVIATGSAFRGIPEFDTVTTNELSDLKALLTTKLSTQTDTRFFATRIANGDPANAHYQGAALGNLVAGATGDHLLKLVDKWFLGGDVPLAHDDNLSTLRYERAEGSLFVNGPSYDDVDQGNVGDCYFLAALGEVAKHVPSTIYNMFADNGDGTWTVRFIRNGAPVYVTVNRMLPVSGLTPPGVNPNTIAGDPWAAGFGIHYDQFGQMFQNNAYDSHNELWVALAEKAYVQLNESGGIGQDGTNSYHGIDEGRESDVFKQLTGKSATWHSLDYILFPPSSSDLIKAINSGYAITLSTKDEPRSPLITPNHGYMVTGYNAETKMFQLFNPHGYWNNDDPATGGVQSPIVEMDWSAIMANCTGWTSVLI